MAPSAAGGGVQSGAMEGKALEASPSPFRGAPHALGRPAYQGGLALLALGGPPAAPPLRGVGGVCLVDGDRWSPPRSTPAAALWPFPRLLGCCCCRRSCCRSHRRTQGHTCPKVIPALPHGGGEGGGGPYLPSQASCFVRGGPYWMPGDGAKFVRSSSAAAAAAASAAAHTHAAAVYSFACPLSDMPSAPSFPFAPFAPHAHPRRYPHHHRHCIIPPALRCAAFVCPSVAAQQKTNPRLLDSAASTCISGDRRLCPRSAVVHFAFEPSMTTSRACPVPRA